MYYIKLLVIVIAASIAMWFGVQKLVVSTDQLAESFTADNYQTNDQEGESNLVNPTELVELDLEDKQDQNSELEIEIVSEQDSEYGESAQQSEAGNAASTEPPDFGAEDQILSAELEQVIDNSEDSIEELIDVKTSEIDGNEQRADKQHSESGNSDSVRADSDADMQTDSKNSGESAERSSNSQSKALQLDKKLLVAVNSNDLMNKTIKPEDETVRAIDLAYAIPKDSNCLIPGENHSRVGVHYRPTSFAIKGQSLTNIDKLIKLYRECGGKLLVFDNKVETDESNKHLIQLRQDEVKYYLLQRRVSKDDMIFSDE